MKFNKTNLIDHLNYQINHLEAKWGFNSNNGWAQVEKADFQKVMAYGSYSELCELVSDIQNGNLGAS